MKRRLTTGTLLKTLFTDEKIFTVEQALNKQNDRILSSSLPTESDRGVPRSAHPSSVMVWAGISAEHKSPLIFVDPGVKVNQHYYVEQILAKMLPWAQTTFNSDWLFQQDGAPAHTAKKTQQWLRDHKIDFIAKDEWPGFSPDLNPMDFSIWGYMESRVCRTRHNNLESLKKSLQHEWNKIPNDLLRATILAVPKRLDACIKANGNIFEIDY